MMRQKIASSFASVAAALFITLLSSSASARPTGEAQACANCHYEMEGPMLDLVFSNREPELGETITVTVDIEAVNVEALRTGLFLATDGQGEFILVEPNATRFAEDNVSTAVLHSEPRDLDAGGRAQFRFDWRAPGEAGVSNFTLWSITGNTNGDSADDHHATIVSSIAHGCDGVNYYPDADGDGFGDTELATLSCEPVAGMTEQGGDCNDGDPATNPNAQESCNAVDDNCDGEADEGLNPGLYYPDPDGDGYADSTETPIFGCDEEGYTSELGDCAPNDPDIYPGAPELNNGRDDNCNGEIDETEPGGMGNTGPEPDDGAGSGGSMGDTDDGLPGADTDADSGCRLGGDGGRSTGALWLMAVVAAAGGRRRRRRC